MQLVDWLSTLDRLFLFVLLALGFTIGGGTLLYRIGRAPSEKGEPGASPKPRRAKGVALLLATFPIGCCLAGSLLFLFLTLAGGYRPIPPAYPGAKVYHRYTGTGSWGYTEFYTYTVDLPLDDIQQYYVQQMSAHCDHWNGSFEEWTNYYEYPVCQWASCAIPRAQLEHFFSVVLCPISENKTWVEYVNAHEEP